MDFPWVFLSVTGALCIGGLFLRDYLRKHLDPARPTTRSHRLVAIIALTVLLGTGMLLLYSTFSRRPRHRRISSANNLMQIGKALMLYKDVPANGSYPPAEGTAALIRRLYPGIVHDGRVFLNPQDGVKVPDVPVLQADGSVDPSWEEAAGYAYVDPGPNPTARAILAFERHAHQGGRYVMRECGTVEWMDDDAFRQELRATIPKFTPEP